MLETIGSCDDNRLSNAFKHADIRCCTTPAMDYMIHKFRNILIQSVHSYDVMDYFKFKKIQEIPYQFCLHPIELQFQHHRQVPRFKSEIRFVNTNVEIIFRVQTDPLNCFSRQTITNSFLDDTFHN